MELKEILKLMQERYPNNNMYILIYDDGSGRIIGDTVQHPYQQLPVFLFDTVDELIQHLQEK